MVTLWFSRLHLYRIIQCTYALVGRIAALRIPYSDPEQNASQCDG